VNRWLLVCALAVGGCGDDGGGGSGDGGVAYDGPPRDGSLVPVAGFCTGDVALAVTRPAGAAVYRCASGGGFELAWSSPIENLTSVAFVDLAGDAKPDLLLGRSPARSVVYRREGSQFQSIADLDLVVNTRSVRAGDFDGDGDQDFVLANDGGDNVYRNDSASFVLAWTSTVFEDTRAAAWGNLDGDTDLDLAVAHQTGVRVYRHEAGDFTMNWTSPAFSATAIDWADFDGDDDLDLVVGTGSGGDLVYRNDGSTFGQAFLTPEIGETVAAGWVDYDGDRDPDFLVATTTGARLYRNDGAGSFSLVDAGLPSSRCRAAAWADADGDGDMDLVVQTLFDAHFYTNDGGQLVYKGGLETLASSVAWGIW
jgi:hypothetical protein